MKLLKRLLKKEAGQALPMALILLALGGLLVVPTLALMTTNLNANRVVDRANLELYAADAGVEEVMWHLNYDDTPGFLPTDTEGEKTVVNRQQANDRINDRTIVATISKVTGQINIYKITSTASKDGHSTKIECFVDAGSKYSFLLDAAITSAGNVTLQPGANVDGNIVYAKNVYYNPAKNDITGTLTKDTTLQARWPKAPDLIDYYLADVATADTSTNKEITVAGTQANPTPIGRLKALPQGGLLTIKGAGWARLDGTLYVNGNLKFNPIQTGISLDLNKQTIFVTGTITSNPGLTFTGSGCIVAVNKIDLAPSIDSVPSDFILLLSVTDTVWLHPSGNFYGSVAGYNEVQVWPGEIVASESEPKLNFPGMGGGAGGGLGGKAKLLTYTIKIP